MTLNVEKRRGFRTFEVLIARDLHKMLRNVADVLGVSTVEEAAEQLLREKVASDYPEIDQAFAIMETERIEREAQEEKRLLEVREQIKARVAKAIE